MNKIAGALFLMFLIVQSSVLNGQKELDQINNLLKQHRILAHLNFLASDELQGRKTGQPGNLTAAKYIASQLQSYGTVPPHGISANYMQEIEFSSITPPDSAIMRIDGRELSFPSDFIALNGKPQHMTAPFQFVGFGNEDELKNVDLRFKIAVAFCGDGIEGDVRKWMEMSGEKRKRVAQKGGVGLIEIYQSGTIPWNFLRRIGSQSQLAISNGEEYSDLAHFWLGSSDGSLLESLKSSRGSISFESQGVERTKLSSSNVVALIPGTDPVLKEEYIVLSAHYDHVGVGRPDSEGDDIYNGARDNAVGTTAVMMAAEYFAKYPPKRSVLIVLFTAEEVGLLGSKFFVDNSPVDLERIKYCFNIDNGGYNDTTIVSVIGLTRTGAEQTISEACNAFDLSAIEDPAKEQGLFDRSDNVSFAAKGIPAPTFSLGFRAFDQEIFKYYHQPSDEVESLNMNYIQKYMKAFVLSAIRINESKSPYFWNAGDKYYDLGKNLYKTGK